MLNSGVPGRIYSATYSHVPVYELTVDGDQIMRRRADDYVNATHILKAADFDKPARTRILEREVQKGIHEKVQGGYGKYQGTWIPLEDARALAEKNGILEKIRPIFDYVAGPHSPPPAPKHATASSNKPKTARQPASRRVPVPANPRVNEMYDNYSTRETPERASIRSQTPVDFADTGSRYSTQGHRKRKRGMDEPAPLSPEEQAHLMWTDELLDYFMLQGDPDPLPGPPEPPSSVDLDRPVDEKGHTPLHWAAAIGDINLVQDFIQRGARIDVAAQNGETPLMRAVLFTNNYDKQIMDQLVNVLVQTVPSKDLCASTVFHHITATTNSKTKYPIARYYLETILRRMENSYAPGYIAQILDQQDQHGDTAVLIAARHGARKCVRLLIHYGASTEIPNLAGDTAQAFIHALNARRRERHGGGGGQGGILSSSPVRNVSSSAGGPSQFMNATKGTTDSANNITTLANETPAAWNTTSSPSKKPTKPMYRSEAANLLSSQLGILITSRAEQLAAELERETADREAEVSENTRVIEARKQEIERLREECERLQAQSNEGEDEAFEYNGEILHAIDDSEHIASEMMGLETELQELLETVQTFELSELIQQNEGHALTMNGFSQPQSQDREGAETDETRLSLARAILQHQKQRQSLTHQIISTAGLSNDTDVCATVLSNSSNGAMTNESQRSTTDAFVQTTANTTARSEKRAQYIRLIRSALNLGLNANTNPNSERDPQDDDDRDKEEGIEDLLPEIMRELEESKREKEREKERDHRDVTIADFERDSAAGVVEEVMNNDVFARPSGPRGAGGARDVFDGDMNMFDSNPTGHSTAMQVSSAKMTSGINAISNARGYTSSSGMQHSTGMNTGMGMGMHTGVGIGMGQHQFQPSRQSQHQSQVGRLHPQQSRSGPGQPGSTSASPTKVAANGVGVVAG